MRHLIARTSNNIPVYINLIQSDAAKRIAQQPRLLGLAAEVVQKKSLPARTAIIEHNLGRTIGYTFIVPTTDASSVFYACILHDTVYTRFVKNAAPLATSFVTLSLHYNPQGFFEVQDVWVGRVVPPRPGSPDATDQSLTYWAQHAFVFDKQPLQIKTLTKETPEF